MEKIKKLYSWYKALKETSIRDQFYKGAIEGIFILTGFIFLIYIGLLYCGILYDIYWWIKDYLVFL